MTSISASRPRVFSISMPSRPAVPTHDDSGSEFSHSGSDSDSNSDDDLTHRKRNGDIVLSMRELKVSVQRELHLMMMKSCRGTAPGRTSGPVVAPRSCDVLYCPPDCMCSDCPRCVRRQHKRRHGRRPSLRNLALLPAAGGALGDIAPTPAYLREVAVPSKPTASSHPLVVLSLDMVLDARLPKHLRDGYTDVLSRPYLHTLIEYILHLHSPWSVVFYTSLTRKQAMKTLKELKLPTGSPEKDERDGVMGVFSKEDMRRGWKGGELEVKDLQSMWDTLYEEEGVRWSSADTVVFTDNPAHLKAQPFNFVLLPTFQYRNSLAAANDPFYEQMLLQMIAVLKDLETETNFAYHIKELGWNLPQFWLPPSPMPANVIAMHAMYVHMAVKVCASARVDIVAYHGN